jgi:hypothetical protein
VRKGGLQGCALLASGWARYGEHSENKMGSGGRMTGARDITDNVLINADD